MKILAHSMIKPILILGFSLFFFILKAQTIQIDSTFSSDTQIFPFEEIGTVYGIRLNGTVTINSDTSLIRIILRDTLYNEYLVYEAYSCISTSNQFAVSNACDETCYSNGLVPGSLQIQIINASLVFTSLNLSSNYNQDGTELQQKAKEAVELQKATNINSYISRNHMVWLADTNSISNLAYAKKKALFGNSYNNMGLDYYRGGIYDPSPNSAKVVSTSTLITHWDWRNRHGANNPNKGDFYYNPGNNGWLTSIKDQLQFDCTGLCYIYAPLASLEAVSNLYFNFPYNYDLSEQQVLECDEYDTNECIYGDVSNTNAYISTSGVIDEEHYPRREKELCINNPNAEYRIKAQGFNYVNPHKSDDIKIALIKNGPLNTWHGNYYAGENHFMSLIGFGKCELGDTIQSYPAGNYFVIDESSVYIGANYFIYKNSWGSNWGSSGFMTHIETNLNGHPEGVSYYITPIDDILTENDTIRYYDKDKDGYYYWGIGNKPDGCPDTEADSDDSEPRLGPFDNNYFSVPVAPTISVDRGSDKIHQQGVYSFYDGTWTAGHVETLTFTVSNEGNAQLNLLPDDFGGTITLAGSNDFEEGTYIIDPSIDKTNGSTSFDIKFTLRTPINEPKMVTITIHLNEVDMEDFVFTLVFSNCTNTQPENISGITTWNSPEALLKFGDVHVLRDALLTINGLVAFTQNASLIVEQGGTVIIDGGHITSFCNKTWKGIDVWGDINKSQFSHPPEARQEQGVVRLKNGGKISYAETAIETIKYINGQPDYTTSGGVVSIWDGTIEECTKGVVFYPYENFYPDKAHPQSNWSYFNRARFFNENQVVNDAQLKLNGVNGMRIQGSSFENKAVHNHLITSFGIKSFNSGFSVNKIDLSPMPSGGFIPCSFKGFEYGIHATAGRLITSSIGIRSSYFEDNERSIFLSAIENPVITSNEFKVRDINTKFDVGDNLIGIYLDNSTDGFTVEENRFYSYLQSGLLQINKCAGIVVNNSGENPNELYNNSFDKLTIGIEAIGNNRDLTGAGLCIKCNDFINCRTDIYVTHGDEPTPDPKLGIAVNQGEKGEEDPTKPAGNTFTEVNMEVNFENDINCGSIIYTYHGINPGNVKLQPDPISNTISQQPDWDEQYSKTTACPSHLGGSINLISEKILITTEAELIENKRDTIKILTDGGNTAQLQIDVANAIPAETIEIRQELIDKSPYLSDTVILTAIKNENAIPNAILRDVLILNPQSAKSSNVINSINNRITPVPDYLIEEIIQGRNVLGGKEILEHDLNNHSKNYYQSLHKIETYYQSDTLSISVSKDSLVELWQNQPFPVSKYKLAFIYLSENDFVAISNILNSITTEYELTPKEENIHDLYSYLFELLWQIQTDSIGLDSTKKIALLSLAENYKSKPGTYAMNLLLNDGEIIYEEPFYFPESTKSAQFQSNKFKEPLSTKILKIFPNPASGYFIAEYDLNGFKGKMTINLRDLVGNNLYSEVLSNSKSQIVILIMNFPSGIYLVDLQENGHSIEAHKIVIIK